MSHHCKECGSDETEYVAEESFPEVCSGYWGCYNCGHMEAVGVR